MATIKDRIATLLVQGMKPRMIASIVGCDESYISQLLKNEDFVWHLEQLGVEMEEAATAAPEQVREKESLYYLDKLAGAEHHVLDKVLTELPYLSGRDALAALSEVGKRRDAMQASLDRAKGLSLAQQPTSPGQTIINLVLPAMVLPELTFASNREIIAIGERSVAPMPTGKLQAMLDKESEAPLEAPYETHAELTAAL